MGCLVSSGFWVLLLVGMLTAVRDPETTIHYFTYVNFSHTGDF